jgi:hypothetical protein
MLDKNYYYSVVAAEAERASRRLLDLYEHSTATDQLCFERTMRAVISSRRMIERSDTLIRSLRGGFVLFEGSSADESRLSVH